MTEKSFQSSYN